MSRIPRIAGACPYLSDAPPWRILDLFATSFEAGRYEAMLAEGWRRSGLSFYRPACEGCARCIPIRVDARHFAPSPSQRRAARRNRDLRLATGPLDLDEARLSVYKAYVVGRHGHEPILDEAAFQAGYEAFLLTNPLGSGLVMDYRRAGDGALLASGYLDVLPDGLSSVYFAWDPAEARRSLGVFSVLAELEYCARAGKRWYYLGFWVPGSRTMGYKADFGPAEVAIDGRWRALDADTKARLEADLLA